MSNLGFLKVVWQFDIFGTFHSASQLIFKPVIYMYSVSQKKHPRHFSYNLRKNCRIFVDLANVLPRNQAISRCYSFQPHLTSASALPEKMQQFRNSIISLKCCITALPVLSSRR